MTTVGGVVVGIVDSLDDPEGLSRVRLTFPWLSEGDPPSAWARIAVPMAGGERGMRTMPEVGDEALVAFEHGDLRRPFVVGYLWNGVDRPPGDDLHQRAITTVSGHELTFDDTPGEERIALRFRGDTPAITIDREAIEIRFDGSSYIRLSAVELTIVNTTRVSINP